VSFSVLATFLLILTIARPEQSCNAQEELRRVVFVVGIHADPDWRDMLVPCVVPAARKATIGGEPMVIFVLESNAIGHLSTSEMDFLSLYKPERIYLVGLSSLSPTVSVQPGVISTPNEMDASAEIAVTFWDSSRTVVLALEDDYEYALLASTIASRFNLPLLYVEPSSVHESVRNAVQKLSASEAIVVANRTVELGGIVQSVTLLANDTQVAEFIAKQGPVNYLVLTNPLDRSQGIVKKLSLNSAVLAAGRNAVILPTEFTQERYTFDTDSATQCIPDGAPDGVTVGIRTPSAQFRTEETTEPPIRAPNATWQVYPVNGKYQLINHVAPGCRWVYLIDGWHHMYFAASRANSSDYDTIMFDRQILDCQPGYGCFSDDEVFHQGDIFEYSPECSIFHCYLKVERIGQLVTVSREEIGLPGPGSPLTILDVTIEYLFWKEGTITAKGESYPFVLSCANGATMGTFSTVNVDLNGNGCFNDTGEGPFMTGDTIWIGNDSYTVIVDPCGLHVRLFSPSAKVMALREQDFISETKILPHYLAIVAYPDAIPPGAALDPMWNEYGRACNYVDEYLLTDTIYGQLDSDPFMDVAVGRIMAENVTECSSLVARTLGYDFLSDENDWRSKAYVTSVDVSGTMETGVPVGVEYDLRNVGFDVSTCYWTPFETQPAESILSSLAGKSLIFLGGHGNQYSVGSLYVNGCPANPIVATTEAWTMRTPSVLLVYSCNVGRVTVDIDPHASLLNCFISRGSVAVFAALGFPWSAGEGFYSALATALLYHNTTIGDALLYAQKYAVLRSTGSVKESWWKGPYKSLLLTALFGDPSIRVVLPAQPTKTPATASVTSESDQTFHVSVSAPEECFDFVYNTSDVFERLTHISGAVFEPGTHCFLVELKILNLTGCTVSLVDKKGAKVNWLLDVGPAGDNIVFLAIAGNKNEFSLEYRISLVHVTESTNNSTPPSEQTDNSTTTSTHSSAAMDYSQLALVFVVIMLFGAIAYLAVTRARRGS